MRRAIALLAAVLGVVYVATAAGTSVVDGLAPSQSHQTRLVLFEAFLVPG